MLFSIPQYFGLDAAHGGVFKTIFGWASLALALPVLLFSASDYWKSASLALRQRMLTLDVPIALGLAAIYGHTDASNSYARSAASSTIVEDLGNGVTVIRIIEWV